MPHKRAKLADRKARKADRGIDLAPDSNPHLQSMPKGAMRILDAARIQAEYRERKRQHAAEQASKAKGTVKNTGGPLQIKEGEKLKEFNQRVESAMAKDVNASIRASRDSSRKRKRKPSSEENSSESASTSQSTFINKHTSSSKEPNSRELKRQREVLQGDRADQLSDWQKSETRKRVNDVVLAPPTLTKAPRGESKEARQRKAQLKVLMSGNEEKSYPLRAARLPDPVVRQQCGLRREGVLQEERTRVIQAYRRNKRAQLDPKSS